MKYGIDISQAQMFVNLDFKRVSEDLDFVIMRLGESTKIDDRVKEYNNECIKYSIPRSYYWYTHATDSTQVERECEVIKRAVLENKIPKDAFVFIDIEYTQTIKIEVDLVKLYKHFEEVLKSVVHVGLYTFAELYRTRFAGKIQTDLWLAHWNNTPGQSSYNYGQLLHQYGLVKYANAEIDGDAFTRPETEFNRIFITENKNDKVYNTVLKPYYIVANEVINGDWGNGDDRRNRLMAAGYDYKKVQSEVNDLLQNKIHTITVKVTDTDYEQINDLLTKLGY